MSEMVMSLMDQNWYVNVFIESWDGIFEWLAFSKNVDSAFCIMQTIWQQSR